MSQYKIIAKIIVKARLITTTPLRIANGQGGRSDLVLLRRPEGPYLPGASFAGAIHSRWLEDVPADQLQESSEHFWGTTGEVLRGKKTSSQSHFRLKDMTVKAGTMPIVSIRDGVRIDPQKGTVDGNGKYDYELLEPGAEFDLSAEITVREGMSLPEFLRITRWFCDTLQDDLRVGGNTTKGFGCIAVQAGSLKCWVLEFPQAATDWMRYCDDGRIARPTTVLEDVAKINTHRKDFILEAEFSVKNALMIGSPASLDLDTDKGHLRSNGKPIISGRSLIGVMRHRAQKILAAVGMVPQAAQKHVEQLFGYVDEVTKNAARSRIFTREADISAAGKLKKQTRIRLDRFIAAPVDGGLYDSAPIWTESNGKFKLWWRIANYQDWEAALLLHLLKDLWTGDLSIGGEKNVGRGVLVGHSATVTATGLQFQIKRDSSGLESGIVLQSPEDQLKKLRQLNTALHQWATSRNTEEKQ
jgi:CRISPR/Cas system CSM-associated protein Csm3 (group 7 of RAMP superfamily)